MEFEQKPFGAAEFIDNPEPRCACLLLLAGEMWREGLIPALLGSIKSRGYAGTLSQLVTAKALALRMRTTK